MSARAPAQPRADQRSWNITTMGNQSPGLRNLSDTLGVLVAEGLPVVVITPDLSTSNGLTQFEQAHPSRFLQMGISEQNALSVAAGLATTGVRPYVAGFASFLALLCCEQIRTDVAYTRQPVQLVSHHAGIAFGFYGTSHHATEDIAIMRSIANMTVIAPADWHQFGQALRHYAHHELPVYYRLGRGREPDVYSPDGSSFVPGKAIMHGTGTDVGIIATGTMVHPALAAAALLRQRGIEVTVLDMHTIKPLDTEAVLGLAERTELLLTVEEHTIMGGLGGAVSETLTQAGSGTRLHRHGLPDEFVVVGPPTHLYRHYRLDAAGIGAVVCEALSS